MDKGKSKGDLRAAGKKRLEAFRQKRQQKESSTRSSTTALKALTEKEQSPGENSVEGISRRESLSKEVQRSLPEKDGEVESVADRLHEAAEAREEQQGSNVDFDSSPASSVTSSIQRLKVGGHLAPETSEQSVESPCEPGSSNGNLEDKDREAVYTILWENHGTDHSQRNEEWQESAFDRGSGRNERALDQGNYSTFRVDDENYESESVEGSNTQRRLSVSSIDAVDRIQSSEGIKEWDERPLSPVPSQQRPVHDAETEEGRKDVLPVDQGFEGHSSSSSEECVVERSLPEREKKVEKEKADMVAEIALLLKKLEQIVEESGREREVHENEISSLKAQVMEKVEAVSARDDQLEELGVAKALSEQELRTALDRTEKEKEQLLQECMDVKSQVGRLTEERDKFLRSIDIYEKDLEVLRADSTKLAVQMNCLSKEKNQLTTELCAARKQAAAALKHEAQLLHNLRGLEEEREGERTRLQSLEVQLEDIQVEKTQLEVRFGELSNALEELKVVNKQLSDELAVSEQERNMVVMSVAEESNTSRDRIATMEGEQLKSHALVQNLTHRLSMSEEKVAAAEALVELAKNFEEECKRLQLVVENLEINLHSLEDEKAEFGSKFKDLQVEKEALITEVEIAKNELKVAQSQLEVSRADLSEIVEELSTVKLEFTKALEDKSKMQLDEEESRQKLEHLKDQLRKLETNRSQIEEFWGQKLQLTEENVRVLVEQKVGLEELLVGAKHDLEQLNEQLKRFDAENEELKETSAIAVKVLEEQVQRVVGEHSELEELCRHLSAELQLANGKVDTLVAEKVGMEATAEMLHRKATALEDRNSELDRRSNILIEEKDRLVSELACSHHSLESIQAERVQLESELRLLREKLLQIKEENEHIRSDWETLQETLNSITSEKEFVVNQLIESQDVLLKISEESRNVASELSVVMKKLDESTELNNKLTCDMMSLQETLQEVDEVKSRVQTELEETLSKLNGSSEDQILLSSKLDTLLHTLEVLEIEKAEFRSHVQKLQEAVNQKDEELSTCKEERKEYEVSTCAKLDSEVAKSLELTTEICNLKAELQILKQQLQEQRDQMNDKASNEPRLPTSGKESEGMSLADFENVSPRSRAANVKLVKKLVEVFEGKVTDDVPIQNQRDLVSPVTQFFIQAQAMRKTTDDLQRDRDAATLAETTLRADVDTLTMKLHDAGEERCNLQATVTELQEKLAILTADCGHLNQTIDNLINGDGEGVKMVAVLEGDKCALQARTLELVDKLRAAEESIQSLLADQVSKQDLQKLSKELDAELQVQRDASKTILSRLEFLSNYIDDHVLTITPELVWTSESADPVSQVEYKVAILMNKFFTELVAQSRTVGEERDLARTDLHILTESNNVLQAERSGLILEKEGLKAELQVKMTNETEARAVYEGRIDALTSSLAEAENQLDLFRNERMDFEKKLLVVTNREFPDRVVELSGTVESTFDFCWFLVEAILEGTAQKLEDMRMKLSHENSELNAIIAEERLQHQASVVDVEAVRELLRQERDGLFERVKLLEKELTLLQEEQERVSHEYQALLELEAKAKVDRQEKIQMLESTVGDLQRGSEERDAEETEARSVYERDMKSLNSRLQCIQCELDKVRDLHIRFDEKLESAARGILPIIEVKPVDFKDNLFDYSWAIVNLILEEYSRRLQHAHADRTELESKVSSGKEEEIRVLQELVQRITEELAAAKEERDEVSEKVKVLEEERTLLQEEQERVTHELELEAKAKIHRQEKIQLLESTVDDLQRGLEDRQAEQAEAKSAYERDMKLLNSRLQSIQSELDKVRSLHTRFDEKLESAAREVLPIIEMKPADFEDNLFDYSWAIVNLILEEYSRKLQQSHVDMTELESKMNSGKEEETPVLQELLKKTTAELAVAKEEKGVAQLELAQFEKRLAGTKERLTLAINKGKSIVVQRDAVKASLVEKTAELERVAFEHKEMMQQKDIALQEAEATALSLKVKADQAEFLKVELVEARNISERLETSLSETKSSLIDLEIAVDNITPPAGHVSETRVAKLEWVAATLKDLQMRLSYYESKAESLITDLTTVSNEKEVVLEKLQDVSLECERLEKITDEDALSIAALKSEVENLQGMIVTMEAEATQHLKLQDAVRIAIGVLNSGQDSEMDPTFPGLFSESELGAAVVFHVNKYKSAVHEMDELREQSVSLCAIKKLEEEKAFVSAVKLQSLQGMLQTQDIELRDAISKLEGATGVISELEKVAKVYLQQNESLKEELIKCNEDFGMLTSNFSLAEKEMICLKNELHEVLYSFNSVSSPSQPNEHNSQVAGVTLSMSEMVSEVNSLVKTLVEQAHQREIELQTANERAITALMLESYTRKELLAKFEQEFLDSRNAVQTISWLDGPLPPSNSLLDWVTWLIDALKEEHRKFQQAFQETGLLTKTAEINALEVQGLQEKSDSLFAELSNQRNEKHSVANELRRRDLELQNVKDKLQELADNKLALESEVESVRSLGRLDALIGIEELVEDFGLQGRPSTSSPTELIAWLIHVFREISQELKTSKRAVDVLSLQAEEANHNYSILFEELLSQKDANENLQNKLKVVYETLNVERDSLKAEIQVLKASSMKFSSREIEFSEAHRAVTNLQETLAFKEKEISELHDEIEELSLKHAQQDSKLQNLMEERERLSSEAVEIKAERNHLRTELTQATSEKCDLKSDINQLEQKLVAVREKLNLAINKGKGLAKQRDSLKQSLADETSKVEIMVLSHAKEFQSKDSELLETRAQAEAMGTRVQELEAEVLSLTKIATASQQRMQTERQRLDIALSGIEISEDVLSEDSIEKVKWLVSQLEGTRNSATFFEEELDSSRNALETLKAVLRDTEERLQAVTVESLRAQESISASVKKAEEVESRATYERAQYESEIDGLTTALKEADLQQQAAWSRVKELEKAVDKHQNTINASEVARSKTLSKLTFTRNKLNLLVQDSQELVRECESLHKSLQERNAEIADLNQEVDRLQNIIHADSESSLQLTLLQEELARANEKSAAAAKELRELHVTFQSAVKEKDSEVEGVRRRIEDILLNGDNVLWMEHNTINQEKGDDSLGEIDVQSVNRSQDFASVITTLEQRFDKLVADAQMYRNSSDKKEAQIQKLKKELHDLSIEKTSLQAGVQAKALEVERLRSEVIAKVPVEESTSTQSEIEELGTRSTWVGPSNPAARPRRHSQADVVIEMDDEDNSKLLSDMNDKEHGFSALTNSRLVPKATRILADRVDGLWFAGGRILTRQPSARLGLAMYWIIIHFYMAMVLSRGIL